MKRTRGFTLIEILVVVSIIGLLMGILAPSLAESRRITRRTVCLTNIQNIGVAIRSYLHNNRDTFFYACSMPTKEAALAASETPPRKPYPSLPVVLKHELGGGGKSDVGFENKVFLCPSDKITKQELILDPEVGGKGPRYYDSQKTSYEWNVYLNGLVLGSKSVRVFKELLKARPQDVYIVGDFEAFHVPNSGNQDSPKTYNAIYCDFQPRSDKAKPTTPAP